MPSYDYRCTACGHEFEADQRITDDPLTDCPSCGGHIERQIGPCMFLLRGSGWPSKYYKSITHEEIEKSKARGEM